MSKRKSVKGLEIEEIRLSDGTVLKGDELAELNKRDISRLKKKPVGGGDIRLRYPRRQGAEGKTCSAGDTDSPLYVKYANPIPARNTEQYEVFGRQTDGWR